MKKERVIDEEMDNFSRVLMRDLFLFFPKTFKTNAKMLGDDQRVNICLAVAFYPK